jgi:hypothetical protein
MAKFKIWIEISTDVLETQEDAEDLILNALRRAHADDYADYTIQARRIPE